MSPRYRRGKPTRGESVASAAASILVGVGVGAAVLYVTRLFLSRVPMSGREAGERLPISERLPTSGPLPTSGREALPPGREGSRDVSDS